MKRFVTVVSFTALVLALSAPLSAENVVKVGGRLSEGNAAALESAQVSLHLAPDQLPQRAARGVFSQPEVVLPVLTAQERASLQQTSGSQEKGLRVGIGRDVPTSLGKPDTWNWVGVAGGQVAHLGLTSPGAERIRVQVQVGDLPEGVELRFYAPTEPDRVYGPITRVELAAHPKDATGQTLFWSPSVTGDTLKMEVFLPEGLQAADLQLSIPQLSHLAMDPATGKMQEGVLEANTATCEVDIACATPEWQREASSIGAYLFTTADGGSGICSGTLVNTTKGNSTPYLLTANHCINNAADAASMNFIWHYSNSACGIKDAVQRAVLTTGGSKLLVTDKALDTTLVQLNVEPPYPSFFAGWWTTPLNKQEAIAGIHHSASSEADGFLVDAKTYSHGGFISYAAEQNGKMMAIDTGNRAAVQWVQGITKAGGSGSGLWVIDKGEYFLKGVLSSGSSSCANPGGVDFYTRLDQAYPMLKPWLNPTP